MPNNETLAFAEAVRLTLAYCGAEVFEDPQRFTAYLNDMTDNRSEEMRVLKNNCTAELLSPFKGADSMTSVDLKRAAGVAQEYLVDECLINAETSRNIARGIAEGVAKWRGLTIDWGDADVGNGGVQGDVPHETPAPKKRWHLLAAAVVALVLAGWGIAAMLPGIVDALSKLIPSIGATGEDKGIWVCTSMETKQANGEVSYTNTRTYDAHGNELSYDYEDFTEDGDVYTGSNTYGGFDSHGYPAWTRSNTTTTDAEGTLTSQYRYSTSYTYVTDGRGHLKTRTMTKEWTSWYKGSDWDDPWHDYETTIYTYEGDNILKKEVNGTSVHGESKYADTSISEYDRYGNMTHYSSRNSHDGEVYSMWDTSTTYQLDDDGTPRASKRIMTDTYDDETTVTVTTSEYDEHGYVIEEVETEGGTSTTTRYENKYDDNGNIVRSKNLTDGSVTTYEYLYIEDPSFAASHQNWR